MDMYELESSNMAIEAWTYDKFKEKALNSSLILKSDNGTPATDVL